jgi:hypothetical protein
MARSGGLFTPFGPSSQAPTLFRFALLEPEEVDVQGCTNAANAGMRMSGLIISVALTNTLRDK